MSGTIKGLLLIQGLDLGHLVETYRLFFLGLLPSMFVLAVLIEFVSDLSPFTLVKRAFISVLILSSISTFYHSTISASIDAADSILDESKASNILLMDMFDGGEYLDELNTKQAGTNGTHDDSVISRAYTFLKYQLFNGFVNDGLTVVIFFITKLCFLILKVVYSLVYYLGIGLIGIPCILYLFPGMGGVMKGAVVSFVWCLIVPHVLVFILTIIGSEINRGYTSGQIIGGSIMGTALLFILTLFIAFTPLIAGMILSGSGMSGAGGIIATLGANYVMSLPKTVLNLAALKLSGEKLGNTGPKMKLASMAAQKTYNFAKQSFAQASSAMGSPAMKSQNQRTSAPNFNSATSGRPGETGGPGMGPVSGPNTPKDRETHANSTNQSRSSSSLSSAGHAKSGETTKTQSGQPGTSQGRAETKFPRSPSHLNQANQNSRRNYNGTVPESRPSNRTHQTPPNLDRGYRSRPPVRPARDQHHGSQHTR
ncbi:MAG: hypothetical protein HYV97_18835 [Bdellovibrio sp.]|nr:hypothetical protein [Bdellovibrio sp.]